METANELAHEFKEAIYVADFTVSINQEKWGGSMNPTYTEPTRVSKSL